MKVGRERVHFGDCGKEDLKHRWESAAQRDSEESKEGRLGLERYKKT